MHSMKRRLLRESVAENKEAIVYTKSKASRQELTGIVERAGYQLLSLEQAAER